MMKNNRPKAYAGFAVISLLIFFGFIAWKNYIPTQTIAGKYVKNKIKSPFTGPNLIDRIDTLVLFENGVFIGDSWTRGTYKLSSLNNWVHFSFYDSSYSTKISKSNFGEIRIWINSDLNIYLKKVRE